MLTMGEEAEKVWGTMARVAEMPLSGVIIKANPVFWLKMWTVLIMKTLGLETEAEKTWGLAQACR